MRQRGRAFATSWPMRPPRSQLPFRSSLRSLQHPDLCARAFPWTRRFARGDRGGARRYEGRVAITALHGLRGVGKTTLAAAYAERHRGDYRATWWIRAQTETTCAPTSWRLVCGSDGSRRTRRRSRRLPPYGAPSPRGRGLPAYLRQCPRCRGAAALSAAGRRGARAGDLERACLARHRRSRSRSVFGRTRSAPIISLPEPGGRVERAAAEALSEALGGLPLAHEQAAAYCERLDIRLPNISRASTRRRRQLFGRRARCAGRVP